MLNSDIAGFSTLSQSMDAEELVRFLNDYFSRMIEAVLAHGGNIDKFQGDGMLVVFGIDHNNAIAAVVLYQAIGFLVPLIGGGIAYLFLRREFGSMHDESDDEATGGTPAGAAQPAG